MEKLTDAIRRLPEKIDYFFWQGSVDNLLLNYRATGRIDLLIDIAALCVRILDSLYSEVEGWSDELLAQQLEMAPFPNPATFLGLIDSFLIELKIEFALKDELNTNSFVKIGCVCLRMAISERIEDACIVEEEE